MTVWFDKERQRWRFRFWRAGIRYPQAGAPNYCLNLDGTPCASKRAAQDAEAREKTRVKAGARRISGAMTLAEVVAKCKPGWETRKDWRHTKNFLREIIAHFGPGRAMSTISDADIEDYILFCRTQAVFKYVGGKKGRLKPTGRTRSVATVERYLGTLRALFERAYKERDPITGERAISEIPQIKQKERMGVRKARPIPRAVLEFIAARAPQHMKEALNVTRAFGLRKSEVFGLRVSQVDFEAGGIRLKRENTKDKEDAFIPGGAEAMAYMRALAAQARARGVAHIISWQRGKNWPYARLKSAQTAWGKTMLVVERAFGERWRWHDVRAAYISGVVNESGSFAGQHLARHSSYETTKAYVAVESPVLIDAAERASARTFGVIDGGQKCLTKLTHGKKRAARKTA